MVAAVDERERPGAPFERQRAADRGAEGDEVERTRGTDEVDDPGAEEVVDVDAVDRLLQRSDGARVNHRPEALERVAADLALYDLHLLVRVRVAQRRPEQEPVELRLGQRERALLLDRVLGRKQQERLVERV